MTEYRRRISKESSEIVYAAEFGDFSRVEKILKVAPNLINTKTSAGWSATHMAARFLILKFFINFFIKKISDFFLGIQIPIPCNEGIFY